MFSSYANLSWDEFLINGYKSYLVGIFDSFVGTRRVFIGTSLIQTQIVSRARIPPILTLLPSMLVLFSGFTVMERWLPASLTLCSGGRKNS